MPKQLFYYRVVSLPGCFFSWLFFLSCFFYIKSFILVTLETPRFFFLLYPENDIWCVPAGRAGWACQLGNKMTAVWSQFWVTTPVRPSHPVFQLGSNMKGVGWQPKTCFCRSSTTSSCEIMLTM